MTYDLVIDGYNLLHEAGLARARYGPHDLERVRLRLLKLLRRKLTPEERPRTTVVFDGPEDSFTPTSHTTYRELSVIYSGAGREADDVIEELVRAHSAPRQLIVISSDNRLRRAARARQAGSITSAEFVAELDERTKEEPESPAPPSPEETAKRGQGEPVADVSEWLEAFGEVDPDAIAAEESQKPIVPAPTPTPAPRDAATPPDATQSSSSRGIHRPKRAASRPGEVNQEEAGHIPVTDSELAFWEARVQSLLGDESRPTASPPPTSQREPRED